MRRTAPPLAALLTIAIGAWLVASVAACSSSRNAGPPKVAFVVASSTMNPTREMAAGFSSAVQTVGGVEQTVVGPPIVDGSKELQMFQEQVRSAKAGISVFTLSPSVFAAPMAAAADEGIPLIAVDNPPPPSSNIELFVGNDNYELGRMLADAVASKLPPGATGTVVIGDRNPGTQVHDQRAKGIRERLLERFPGLRVIGPFDSKQAEEANLAAWRTLVKANPTALAFVGTGDADGWNLAAIRRSTGGHWLAGAFDLDPRALDAVRTGDLLLVSPEHFVKGAIAGRLHASHAKSGKPLPKGWYYTPGLAVNQSNLDEIVARQASPEAKAKWFAPVIHKILTNPSYLRPLAQAR